MRAVVCQVTSPCLPSSSYRRLGSVRAGARDTERAAICERVVVATERRRPRRACADLVVGPRAAFSTAAPRFDRRRPPLRLLYLTIAAFAHSSSHDGGERAPSRERVVVRSCAADLVELAPISSAGTAPPSWPTRLVPIDVTTPPSPAATRRRRVCSLEPNKTTTVSARQAMSASSFGRARTDHRVPCWHSLCVPADTPACWRVELAPSNHPTRRSRPSQTRPPCPTLPRQLNKSQHDDRESAAEPRASRRS